MSNKKIAVCTGTRAEYGLLSTLMKKIKADPTMHLQTIVTGTHLVPDFGNTFQEIENDGFTIDKKIPIIQNDDSAQGVAKAMSIGLEGFTKALAELSPELIILLGDRFETFVMATAAWLLKIPIAHIHGGETTASAWDEAFRHSITKMSYLHFTAAKEYRNRVIQLGEDPKRVFFVGALGVEQVKQLKLWGRPELEKNLNIKFKKHNFLITYHPTTLLNSSENEIKELLRALSTLKDSLLIFTKANADEGGRAINKAIENFVKDHANSVLFSSLGQLRYLSLLKQMSAMIGNSSSGVFEAPTLKVPTINVGERQKGRIFSKSVICCPMNSKKIISAIAKSQSQAFRYSLKKISLPFGTGDTSQKIYEVLKKANIKTTIKAFCDL